MAHFVFVVVTHINEQRIRVVEHRVHFRGLEIVADIAGIKTRVLNAIRHNPLTHFHSQHPEGFPVIFQRNVQTHAVKCRIKGVQLLAERLHLTLRYADLGVNPFMRQIDATENIQRG
ncbi:hypothetical protein SDC9_185863 [bioreactor metagenome]|uniref:Uncharacterized protein n=1 Tax=bioreactor metagenome TaxID=1076179 RepID=A0A645HJG1_9ZZZZ